MKQPKLVKMMYHNIFVELSYLFGTAYHLLHVTDLQSRLPSYSSFWVSIIKPDTYKPYHIYPFSLTRGTVEFKTELGIITVLSVLQGFSTAWKISLKGDAVSSYGSLSETGWCWSLSFLWDSVLLLILSVLCSPLPNQTLIREFMWKALSLMQLVIQLKAKIVTKLKRIFGIWKTHGFKTKF